MNFRQWQATGRNVKDLRKEPGIGQYADEVSPGRVYEGDLYMERGSGAAWCLTIGNDSEQSNDRERLERKLYFFGVGEEVIQGEPDDHAHIYGTTPDKCRCAHCFPKATYS